MADALLCNPFVWFADGREPMDSATYRRLQPSRAQRGNARRRELLAKVRKRTVSTADFAVAA